MARTVPTVEPTILVIGDYWNWSKTLGTYPPSEGWALSYSIRGISTLPDNKVSVTSSGSTYTVVVLPVDTAALTAGAYQWQSYVTGSGTYAGQRYAVDTGVFTVVANTAALTGSQGQQHAERVLTKIESEIEARITGTGSSHEHFTIGTRQIQKIPIEQLMRLRAFYQAKVFRYQNPGQLGPRVLAQFNPTDGSISVASPVVLPPWYKYLQS